MDSDAGPRPDSSPDPDPLQLTPALLADLQAGLLDDATAARVRSRARTDPEAGRVLAGLDAVRLELAHLGTDEHSAPAVPASVTAKVGAALRAAPRPDTAIGRHTPARPRLTGVQRAGLAAGICAAAAAVVLGVVLLARDPGPAFPAGPTAAQITAESPVGGFPVPDGQLRAALSQPQELGPLADPQRLSSCLTGLGYSPRPPVLGGRPVDVDGRPAVLLLVPGNTPEQISAVVVAPTCSAAHTGLDRKSTV